jgi:hypothetical protein
MGKHVLVLSSVSLYILGSRVINHPPVERTKVFTIALSSSIPALDFSKQVEGLLENIPRALRLVPHVPPWKKRLYGPNA